MSLSAAMRSNLLRFVEDLLSYMTPAEKRGQLETVVLSPSSGETQGLAPDMLEQLLAGRLGTVVGPRSREEARQLQRLAVERTRLGIPLLFAAPIDDAAWPSPLAMAASWDSEAVEAVARYRAAEATANGLTWLATPAFKVRGAAQTPGYVGESLFLAQRVRDALVRGLSGRDFGADLDRGGHALALLRDRDLAARGASQHFGDAPGSTGDLFQGLDYSDWYWGVESRSERLDEAVRRILLAKAQLGLFREPFDRLDGPPLSGATQDSTARATLTRKAMVLLRNEGAVLPLYDPPEPVLCVDCGENAVGDALAETGLSCRSLSGLALRRDALDDPTALSAADGMAIGIAADAAARAETVLISIGEAECVRGTGLPRPGPAAAALLAALVHANPRVVLIAATALPLDPASLPKRLAAHLHAWTPQPGFREALAAILTGQSAPSGKLPLSLGEPGQPHACPFGHGLTYGSVKLAGFSIEFGCDSVVAQVTVTNPHAHPVGETIQLYVRKPGETEPVLRDFQFIEVPAQSSVEARFELGIAHLGRAEGGGPLRVQAGRHAIHIGRDHVTGLNGEVDIPADLARTISVPATLRDSPDAGARSSA